MNFNIIKRRVSRGNMPRLIHPARGHMPSFSRLHAEINTSRSRSHAEPLEVTCRDYTSCSRSRAEPLEVTCRDLFILLEVTCRASRGSMPGFMQPARGHMLSFLRLHAEINIIPLEVTCRASRGYMPRLISFHSRSHAEPLEVTC